VPRAAAPVANGLNAGPEPMLESHCEPNLPPAAAPAAPPKRRYDRLRLVTLALVVFTLFGFLVLRWDLVSTSAELSNKLF